MKKEISSITTGKEILEIGRENELSYKYGTDENNGGMRSESQNLLGKTDIENYKWRYDILAAEMYFIMGNFKFRLGDLSDAEKEYSAALKFNTSFSEAYHNRGNIKSTLLDYKGAIEDYTTAIAFDSKNADSHINRGNANYRLKRYKDALEDYKNAACITPYNPLIFFNAGIVELALEDYREASMDFTLTIAYKFKLPISLNNRGAAKVLSGQKESGMKDFRKAARLGDAMAKKNLLNNSIPKTE